jgi:hypothetical protein
VSDVIFSNLPGRERRRRLNDDEDDRGFREAFAFQPEGPLPHRKGGPSLAAQPAFTFPAGALGVYSLRKAGAGYAGPCLRALRLSDNAQQDIGFAGGALDMGALATFAAGSTVVAVKWCDQSGLGNDLTVLSGAGAPQINLINGKPWLCSMFNGIATMGTASALSLAGDQTVGFVGQLMSNFCSIPVSGWDGTNGWFATFNGSGSSGAVGATPGSFQYFTTGGGGQTVNDGGRYFARTGRYVAKRASGVGTTYVNGSQTASGPAANNVAATSGLRVGGANVNSFQFTGLLAEAWVYPSALADGVRQSIDAYEAAAFPSTGFSTPYSGTSGVEFDFGQLINCGNVLAYERTASWTVFAAVQLYYFPPNSSQASVIYTNVPGSGTAFPGHEIWIDNNGKLRVRIMSDIGANNYIGVIGTTRVIDGRKHMIAYSYDGSSTAAGIKVYVDGAPETTTIEHDALTGSIIGAGQSLIVGSQQNDPDFTLTGTLAHFQVDAVARSAATIAAYHDGAIPPVDASTDLCLLLNAGSGATAADTSGHARNGTLTTATMWFP